MVIHKDTLRIQLEDMESEWMVDLAPLLLEVGVVLLNLVLVMEWVLTLNQG